MGVWLVSSCRACRVGWSGRGSHSSCVLAEGEINHHLFPFAEVLMRRHSRPELEVHQGGVLFVLHRLGRGDRPILVKRCERWRDWARWRDQNLRDGFVIVPGSARPPHQLHSHIGRHKQ